MEDERILLSISVNGDHSHVKLETHDAEDVFNLALAIVQIMRDHLEISVAMAAVTKMLNDNPEFADEVEKSSVDMNAFNDILKH